MPIPPSGYYRGILDPQPQDSIRVNPSPLDPIMAKRASPEAEEQARATLAQSKALEQVSSLGSVDERSGEATSNEPTVIPNARAGSPEVRLPVGVSMSPEQIAFARTQALAKLTQGDLDSMSRPLTGSFGGKSFTMAPSRKTINIDAPTAEAYNKGYGEYETKDAARKAAERQAALDLIRESNRSSEVAAGRDQQIKMLQEQAKLDEAKYNREHPEAMRQLDIEERKSRMQRENESESNRAIDAVTGALIKEGSAESVGKAGGLIAGRKGMDPSQGEAIKTALAPSVQQTVAKYAPDIKQIVDKVDQFIAGEVYGPDQEAAINNLKNNLINKARAEGTSIEKLAALQMALDQAIDMKVTGSGAYSSTGAGLLDFFGALSGLGLIKRK